MMDDRPFTMFRLSHGVAVAATVLAACLMVKLQRSPATPLRFKHGANVVLAVALILSVGLDPLLTWLRYQDDPAVSADLLRRNSLPLHLCDVVSLVLAVALFTGRQRWAELGYLWGFSATLQGLITPAVKFDWYAPEYYAFFLQHGGVQVAAAGLVSGQGLRPERGALRRAMLWSWLYMALTIGCNALLNTNYGYLNGKPEVASLLDHLGPWPWYLLSLQAVALLFFFLLLLPFRRGRDMGR